MKTTVKKTVTKKLKGEYASIDEFVNSKLKRANQTLKQIDLSKLPKLRE